MEYATIIVSFVLKTTHLYWFARAAVTKYHTLGNKRKKYHLTSLETSSPGVSRVSSF